MIRVAFLLAFSLILSITACKDTSDSAQSIVEDITVETPKPSIPERPREIEVLDLTEDVDLYVVIAGAYSSKEGAQKKADVLRKAGFLNADVVQRPGSNLYSALVERFDSEAEAVAFADEIATNKEIKSYVYKLDE